MRSIVIGLSIAAPVGPIGVLCIRRTLAGGRIVGLVSGLGAATADAAYGFVAAFGLTFISELLINQADLLGLVGGVFLVTLGLRTLLSPAEENVPLAEEAAPAAAVRGLPAGLPGAYASTLALTLTNPMTILAFLGIFAGLGVAETGGDYGAAALTVLGVFLGSALWWLALSGGVSLLRARFDARALRWVNRLSGIIILLFAADILRRLIR